MGRLFLPRLGFISVVVLLLSSVVTAQDNYFVFHISGKPMLSTQVPVQRGEVFGNLDTYILKQKDTVFLINRSGELFELNKPTSYTYSSISNYKKQFDRKSLSALYFTYVWKQFSNQKENRQRPGVVYREDRNIRLSQPMDSIKLNVPEIEFLWKNNTDVTTVYFHLQDIESNHITKIGTSSSSLILYRDNVILKPGKRYKWAVTTKAFPDFGKVKFHAFEILTKEEYAKLQAKMKALTTALKFLGFSSKDIANALCMDYKYCEG
ncbi:hypothetical protein ACFQZJ_00940 [Maribacter chungangensis]|uniref:Uncharacterized protein n=1 Tax=Maribacter chungangensis TaxID=1069117 RepID=A0ABW3B067_9FLAO